MVQYQQRAANFLDTGRESRSLDHRSQHAGRRRGCPHASGEDFGPIPWDFSRTHTRSTRSRQSILAGPRRNRQA